MADYKGLNIRFRGDTTEATKALNILSNEARTAQGNLTGLQKALDNTTINGKNLNKALQGEKLDNLKKSADAARERVKVLSQTLEENRQKLSDLQSQISSKKIDLASAVASDDGTEKARLNISSLEGQLNSLEERERSTAAAVEKNSTDMLTSASAAESAAAAFESYATALAVGETALGQFGANATTLGSNLQSIGSSIASVGDKLTLVSGIAAITFGRQIITNTEEFGNAISQLGGYLDIQGAQLQEMSDEALTWGKNTIFSATESAQAMNELAKGGMTQVQIQSGAMEATMELAAAGGLDMASAAEVAVQAIKTFGLEAKDSSAVADALAGAANKSTAEVSELANGFKYVGGWASMANWNINEVSGALALLSDHGLQSEMAGTALRNVMQRLAAPTNTAAELMEQYGFSVRDSSGQMVSAVEVVQRLNDTFGQLGDEEKQEVLNKIFGARALPAAVALMNEGSASLQNYINATTEAGYAGEMAQNRLGDLGWALELLRGEAETATVTFGNALAPTIIDIAKAIEGALEAFNNLSATQQENIAKMALFATATGPVLSIVGHLTSGIGGVVSALGTGATAFGYFMESAGSAASSSDEMASVADRVADSFARATTPIDGTAESAEKLAKKSDELKSAMSSMATGLGVAAATVAIGAAISKFMELYNQIQQVNEAAEELNGVFTTTVDQYQVLSDAGIVVSESQATLAGSLEQMSGYLQQSSEFAKTTSESFNQLGANATLVEYYANQIKELGSAGELSASQQTLLKDAVSEYNSITNSAVEVTDALHGTLNLLPSEIDEVTAAYKRQAEFQAYQELYADALKQQAQAQAEYTMAMQNMGDVSSDMFNKMSLGIDVLSSFNNMVNGIDYAKYVWGAKGAGEQVKQFGDMATYAEQKINEMGSASYSFSSLQAAMSAAGVTGSQYVNLTEAQLAELLAAFDGTIASIAPLIQKFGLAVGGTGGTMVDAAEEATEDFGTALSGGIDTAGQQAQKALQKQNDAIYKEQQRAYDAEYKALQKALDKEYKAYQKQLTSEEDALKKSLDANYNNLKDSLDNELKEFKKANDKRLKEAKKAYEAQTKAFKAETDKRVKALEAEYKAQLKLLESNYGTDGIDSQIKALENQTKAEQDAIKKQQEAEKKAELEKAVEQAKTRRKRADAEKELNEYLAELAQEAREADREAQIENLKEQKEVLKEELDAKKEALKEEYDARIEALKEARAAEQEVMDEANDLAYERLKEQLDEQYEARKEANDAQLEQLKESNDAQLDAMKEAHSEMLDSLKEQQQAQLEALKQSQEDQLQALKDSLDAQVDAMNSSGGGMVSSANDTTKKIGEDAERRKAIIDAWKKQTVQKHMETGLEAGSAIVTQLLSFDPKLAAAAKTLFDTSKKNLPQMVAEYATAGSTSGQSLSSGLSGTSGAVAQSAQAVANAATNPIMNFVNATRGSGEQGASNFARGIGANQSSARSMAQLLANAAKGPITDVTNEMSTSGWDFGQNFADGIERTRSSIISTVSSIGNSIRSYMHFSVPEKGPLSDQDEWAPDMMDNFIHGMRSKETELATQTRRMAEIVNDEFNPEASGKYSLDYDLRATGAVINKGITEALRSGVPSQKGVTIVVREMNVRKESDIDLVSERLYQKQQQAERRGWK